MNKCNLIENTHREKREKYISKYFNFKYPELDNCVYDLLINNYKVQDKSGRIKTKNEKNYFEFVLKRGLNASKWYKKNDNYFYWLYNTKNDYFLVIPESKLIEMNYIDCNDDNIKLKSSLTINFDNIKDELKNYLFNYSNLDIEKLKGIIN